jgi:hypothetical protein
MPGPYREPFFGLCGATSLLRASPNALFIPITTSHILTLFSGLESESVLKREVQFDSAV